MKVKNRLKEIENGSMHILLWDYETGEVFLRTIWQNLIPAKLLNTKIIEEKINEEEREIRLGLDR